MDASANPEEMIMAAHSQIAAYLATALAAQLALGLSVGLLAGLVHFTLLRWNVRLLTSGASARAIGLQLARLAAVAAIFFVLARIGPWALLSGAGGLLVARGAVMHRMRSA
jgi:F1F0 ATPase subunit 2